MQKSKGIKIAALLCGAVVAITGMVLAVSHFFKGEEFYRSILIYELKGTANIEREGAGEIRAAEDLYLESGDRLTVADGSSMRLKLDDDKYAMVEENSILAIEGAGDAQDSKTRIDLVQGAITNEIQNPLSTDSTYEVNSPNSVMAVRGTIFRVEATTDEEGEACTKVSVFSGKVSMSALLADGTVGEEIYVDAGEEASCIGDSSSGSYLTEPEAIDFENLPLQALNFLMELVQRDAPVTGISQDELSGLIEEAEAWEDEEADYEEDTDEEDTGESDDSEYEDEADDTEDNSAIDNTSSSDSTNSGSTGSTGNTGNTGSTGNTRTPGSSGTTPGTNPGTTPGTNPGTTPGTNPGTAPGTNPGTNPGTASGTNPGTTPGNNPVVTQPKEFTVKFMYQGKVFATQTVEDGQCAEEPIMKPKKSGAWDFDFSTAIKKDTTIKWK